MMFQHLLITFLFLPLGLLIYSSMQWHVCLRMSSINLTLFWMKKDNWSLLVLIRWNIWKRQSRRFSVSLFWLATVRILSLRYIKLTSVNYVSCGNREKISYMMISPMIRFASRYFRSEISYSASSRICFMRKGHSSLMILVYEEMVIRIRKYWKLS